MKNKTRPPRLAVVPPPPSQPPPPALPDRTYAEIGDEFARLSVELASGLELDRLTTDERRTVRTAFALANQAAAALLLLDEQQHRLRVASLDDRCLCGWDRGSHMVAPPHRCEEDARCPGFRDAVAELGDRLADTLPPPAPSAPTLVDSLEGAS